MAQAVQQNLDTYKGKLDKALHEKNALNDVLEKVETKNWGQKVIHSDG